MTERLITHLRHVDLAVPDFDKQLDFFTGAWGLTAEHTDTGLAFLAAEGSPEQYVGPAAAGRRQARRPASRSARPAPPTWTPWPRGSAADGVRLVSDPGAMQTPGGGYGFRFFDNEGRTVEVSADVAVRAHRKVEEGESVPVRLLARGGQLGRPRGHRRLVRAAPRLRAFRHAHAPAHGRDDVVPADQPLAPQPRHRPLPAPVAAPRLVRAARHRRVHARHRPAAARRRGEDLGPGRHLAGNNTFSYFLDPHGNTVEYTTELEQVDEDTWHPHLYDFTQPEVADQWGTANQMNEFVARKSFNEPDPGLFSAPPV